MPAMLDAWLADLDLRPVGRAERDGIHSWDLLLDGRRRPDIRLTIILVPDRALLLWVHYAPPLNDAFRATYRQLLRWNDELPFVKFALAEDDRLVLSSELSPEGVSRDGLGRGVARLLAVCDLTLDRAVPWLSPGARSAPPMGRPSRQAPLLERYADELADLLAPPGDAAAEATVGAAAGTSPDDPA